MDEIWKFLAGLGLFLYGMTQLELVLKAISGRSLKLFLKHNTKNLFKAIFGGAIITGLVQSSSVVSLIVLAFVESGIISFRNAMGVILGTNVGTTLDSWIVALVGFKLNVVSYALPIIAISSIGMFSLEKRKNLYNLCATFFALGILFLSLAFMKDSALVLVNDFDLKAYTHYNSFVFVLIGLVLTTIIQSSSATVAITLTAIFAGALTLHDGAAVVIGSEIGTTIKILLWGLKGSADKKRVAWGNFIYNVFTAVIAFLALDWLLYFIQHIVKINDPLIGLVFFQTFINILSIILFIPFLHVLTNWLESKFTEDSVTGSHLNSDKLPQIPLLATETLQREAIALFQKTLQFNRNILGFNNIHAEGLLDNLKSFAQSSPNVDEAYARLKQTEGLILAYYAEIQRHHLDKEDATLLLKYIDGVRQSIYAAKAIKDIAHNLHEFKNSSKDTKFAQVNLLHQEWIDFEAKLQKLLHLPDEANKKQAIDDLLAEVLAEEKRQKEEVISFLQSNHMSEIDASTLMNVHRELLSCKKSLLAAISNIEIDAAHYKHQ